MKRLAWQQRLFSVFAVFSMLYSALAFAPRPASASGIFPQTSGPEPPLSAAQILQPIPAKGAALEALREATFLLGEGDRLKEANNAAEARKKWLAATTAYQRAGDPLGAADAYLRLADSYQIEAIFDAQKMQLAVEYYFKALFASAGVYETLIQKDLKFDQERLAQAEAVYKQGQGYYEAGDCPRAMPALDEARKRYRALDYGAGEVRALMIKARCLIQDQQYMQVLPVLLDALLVAESLPPGSPTTQRYLEAKGLYEKGDFPAALTAYQSVLEEYRAAENASGIAQTTLDLGAVRAALGNYSEAEELLRAALGMFVAGVQEEYDKYNQAAARHNLANVLVLTGRPAEALDEYGAALRIWQESGEPAHQVTTLSGLALALSSLGRYADAFAVLASAQQLQKRLTPNPETEADLLNNIGLVHHAQGSFEPALAHFQQALAIRRQAHLATKELESLSNIAAVYAELGRFDEALKYSQQALARLPHQGSSLARARMQSNIASIYVKQGDYQAALATYLEALDVLKQRDARPDEASVRANIAATYLLLGDLPRAETWLQEAQQAFEALGDPTHVAEMQTNLGMLLAREARWEEAEQSLQQALAAGRKLNNRSIEGRAQGDLALVALARGDAQTAGQRVQEALVASEAARTHADRARLLVSAGLISLAQGHTDAALNYARQAQEAAVRVGDPLAEIGSYLPSALVYLERQDYQQGYRTIQQAIARLEAQQGLLTVSDLKSAFLGQLADLYDLAVLSAMAADQPEAGFEYAEQSRARAFLDQLGNQRIDFRQGAAPELIRQEQALRQKMIVLQEQIQEERSRPLDQQRQPFLDSLGKELEDARGDYAELQTRLQLADPAYASLRSMSTLSLEEVRRQALDEHVTLVVYYVLDALVGGQTLAWVVDRDGYRVVRLDVTPADLRNKVEFLSKVIREKEYDAQTAAALYDGLIAPLKTHIRTTNLVIVPHGVLHYLPFAALWNAQDTRYLAQEYAITYAPSASTLKLIQDQRNPDRGRLLALGNPDGSLPQAEAEARAVAREYGATPLLGKQATESQVRGQAGNTDVLHLAAHGVYNPLSPLFSRIELAPGGDDDGNLEVHEIYGLDLTGANLVVLSACDSAAGELSEGDELVGLSRAFISAGAPAIVTSLWPIDDEASAALMELFHRNLRRGLTNAEALRGAQLEIMARAEWQKPYYWAAFDLTGDYRGNGNPNLAPGAAGTPEPARPDAFSAWPGLDARPVSRGRGQARRAVRGHYPAAGDASAGRAQPETVPQALSAKRATVAATVALKSCRHLPQAGAACICFRQASALTMHCAAPSVPHLPVLRTR